MSTDSSYDIVLSDLEDRQRLCAIELERLSEEQKTLALTIGFLRRITSTQQQPLPFIEAQVEANHANAAITNCRNNENMYAGLSTRWAILYLLAENSSGPMGRSEIAKALLDGGITSSAQSFASNVSAVLSGMANERKEVKQVDGGGYRVTDHGRAVWEGITRTTQWSARRSTVA